MTKRKSRQKRISAYAGATPGTLIADPDSPRPVVRVMAYGPDRFMEEEVQDIERLTALRGQWPVVWLNIDGLGDVGLIARVGELFHLHPLALEDAVNVRQRAKVDLYDDHLFIVARMVTLTTHIDSEQVSFFVGEGFVISFQQGEPGDSFGPVRERVRKNAGLIRRMGPDYLAYELLDAIIDGYFPVLEDVGERLEQLEDEILARPQAGAVGRLHETKRDLLALRRAAWPLREATNSLARDTNRFLSEETRVHMRDCYDHAVRIIDFVETDRELASDLMDLYLSSINQRMTEIMKVLTIISTVFIPLTFIVGLYGMNFNTAKSRWNMPELNWAYGYPFVLILMVVITVGMLLFFRHKGWMSAPPPPAPPDDHKQ
jgi:magnesium transporter